MDARAVAEIAEIEVGTLNVWVQRGIIPGMSVGTRGRQRDIDLETAIFILVMAELVKIGFGAPAASQVAMYWRHWPRLLFARRPSKKDKDRPPEVVGSGVQTIFQVAALFDYVGFVSEEGLSDALRQFPDGPPSVYIIINTESLSARMRQAYHEWEQSQARREH